MRLRNLVARHLPTPLYCACRRIAYLPGDIVDALLGRRPGKPPRGKAFVYGTDPAHEYMGGAFLKSFVELGGLQPDHAVLEIGSGIGRIAGALAGFLSERGSYRGFDIVPGGIAWFRAHITPSHPNFRFDHADIFNRTYNPRGRLRAADFRFPYGDATFDFAYTTSVFTHMLPDDVRHYLQECRRVLTEGGRCLHTFFLLNGEAEALLAQGRGQFDFRYRGEGYRAVSRREPEKAVAYAEEDVRRMFAECGLRLLEPVHFGSWPGRRRCRGAGQDMVVAEKRSP